MKLLVDMNLSPRWIGWFGAAGIDATHWSTVGSATAPDAEIMAAARVGGYVVFTHDLDFGAILAISGASGPSVIQLRAGDVTPEAAGEAVIAAIGQCAADIEAGALLTVDQVRFRVTTLPLRPPH